MTATDINEPDATNATARRFDIFDGRAEAMGAITEGAKADLAGVDRVTLWRWRTGRLRPSLDTVMAIADVFDVPLADLAKELAA